MAEGDADDPGYLVRAVDDDVGRGLFATRRFHAGETILRETPVISCQFSWNVAYGYDACSFCMEPLETAEANARRLANDDNILLPNLDCCSTRVTFHTTCPSCGQRFCSKTCFEEAWSKWHKTLCLGPNEADPGHPLHQLVELWKTFHYPPETVSIMLIVRILASIVQSDDPDAGITTYMSFMHGTSNCREEIVHKMLGENFSSQLEALRQRLLVLFPQAEVQPLLSPDGFVSLFALVARNGQGIGTSPFSQWVKKIEKLKMAEHERKRVNDLIDHIYEAMDRHSGHFLDNDGSGLFVLQSSINHSCVPNAQVEFPFNNHELVVNALKPIEAGEEIRISYLDNCDLERGRYSRQKELRNNYLFVCRCTKCLEQANDPDVTSDEEMTSEDDVEDD